MCYNAPTDDDISVVAGREKGLENVAPATCTKIETLVLWMVKMEAIREVCYKPVFQMVVSSLMISLNHKFDISKAQLQQCLVEK